MKLLKMAILLLVIPFTVLFAQIDYAAEAEAIDKIFTDVIKLYKDGNNTEARQLTQQAYFGHFENLEAGIRINLGQKKSYDMEKQFGDIRKAIKAEKPVEEILSMMDNLRAEIKEVLPQIETGHRLVAEKTEDGGLGAAGMNSAPNDASSGAGTQGSPWTSVYNDISAQLNLTKDAYAKKDVDAMKSAMNKAKFDLYRNKQLEIAIRKYASAQMDQMIQQIMGNILSENLNLSPEKLDQSLKDLNDLILTAVGQLPSDSYSLAPAQAVAAANGEEDAKDFAPVVQNIKDKMAAVLKLYDEGKIADAISDSSDIYFDEYEASGMENIVGAKDVQLKTQTEASFSRIISLMQSKASRDEILAVQNKLFSQLEQSLELTKKSSDWDLFLYALIIILREGFEALIIVAAVIAYLIKSGNSNRLSIVYSALGVAVALSIATAYGIKQIFGAQMAGQSREILEGAVMLIAVLLLFYVGFWLLSNAGSKKWSHYIQGQISSSLSSGDSKMLWWTVFLAVYREGAETVLFYIALIFDAKTSSALSMVGLGFVAGLILLIVVYFVIKFFSLKIAIKPFFIITSIIIFYMSIVFVGKGVMELVEGKLFVPTNVSGFPTVAWLGLYPYVESLVPQAILILLLIVGIFILKKRESNFNKGEKI